MSNQLGLIVQHLSAIVQEEQMKLQMRGNEGNEMKSQGNEELNVNKNGNNNYYNGFGNNSMMNNNIVNENSNRYGFNPYQGYYEQQSQNMYPNLSLNISPKNSNHHQQRSRSEMKGKGKLEPLLRATELSEGYGESYNSRVQDHYQYAAQERVQNLENIQQITNEILKLPPSEKKNEDPPLVSNFDPMPLSHHKIKSPKTPKIKSPNSNTPKTKPKSKTSQLHSTKIVNKNTNSPFGGNSSSSKSILPFHSPQTTTTNNFNYNSKLESLKSPLSFQSIPYQDIRDYQQYDEETETDEQLESKEGEFKDGGLEREGEQNEGENEDEEDEEDFSPQQILTSSLKLTLKMIVDGGYLQPGDVLKCKNQTAVITKEGTIASEQFNSVYATPSSWATAVVKTINPLIVSTCNGWRNIHLEKGGSLDSYRRQYMKDNRILIPSLVPKKRRRKSEGEEANKKVAKEPQDPTLETSTSETDININNENSQKGSRSRSRKKVFTPEKIEPEVIIPPISKIESLFSFTLDQDIHPSLVNIYLPNDFDHEKDICYACGSFGHEKFDESMFILFYFCILFFIYFISAIYYSYLLFFSPLFPLSSIFF